MAERWVDTGPRKRKGGREGERGGEGEEHEHV